MAAAETSAIEIVDFEPAYAPAFRALNTEWLERWFRVEPIDEAVFADPEGRIIAHGGAILFARQGDRIVGTAALKRHAGGAFELTKMAVTARCQGQGIGGRLVAASIARFQALGGRLLYLESHSSLAPALRLYERYGFVHREPPAPSGYERADVYMVYENAPARGPR